jgi:DNA-binding NarL/FixJ family response regulator
VPDGITPVVSTSAGVVSEKLAHPQPTADTGHSDMIKIALIDTLQFSRDCLSRAFRAIHQGLDIIPFGSVKECLNAERPNFDVILYVGHDDGTFETTTLQHVKALKGKFSEVPVVVLSDALEALRSRNIRQALDHGARGFVSTITAEAPAVVSAIRFVKDGGTFVPVDLALATHAPRASAGADEPAKNQLTPRQRSVLSHLRLGKPNKIIAYELGMTESTVKVHIRNIMRKTGATNRTQAVYKWTQTDHATTAQVATLSA